MPQPTGSVFRRETCPEAVARYGFASGAIISAPPCL
jgi:hypothetical protein